MKILPIGVAEAGAWNYAFVYEILQRHFPDLPEQAQPIKRSETRRVLVSRYFDNVVAADRKMVAKVFHVLRWTPGELDRTVSTLLEESAVREMELTRMNEPQLIPTHVLPPMLFK